MQKTTLGIDMGGTKIALGLFDESGKLLFKSRFPTDLSLSAAELMDAIFHNARALLSRAGDQALAGVGIGTPSSVDVERGFVRFTTNIPHWKNAPVRDLSLIHI